MKKITFVFLLICLITMFVLSSCPSGGGGGNTTFTINTPAKFTGSVTVEFQPGIPPAQMNTIRNKIADAWNTSPLIDATGVQLSTINTVLNRGFKIIIENGVPYDGEDIRDNRTIAFHINYLSTVYIADISNDLIGAIVEHMAINMQTKDAVRITQWWLTPILHNIVS